MAGRAGVAIGRGPAQIGLDDRGKVFPASMKNQYVAEPALSKKSTAGAVRRIRSSRATRAA
jgi:hypothetical protein